MSLSLQDRYAPNAICFGCGPKNDKGLRIKSHVAGQELWADWTPEPHHQAAEGMLNGGIVGVLLDCHSNWAACHHLMLKAGQDAPPCTVTSEFHVKLRRPTPISALKIRARVLDSTGDRATIEATIEADGKVTASCRGIFVAVKEGHPAFRRW